MTKSVLYTPLYLGYKAHTRTLAVKTLCHSAGYCKIEKFMNNSRFIVDLSNQNSLLILIIANCIDFVHQISGIKFL